MMNTLVAAYALIAMFFALERLLRRGSAARSLRVQPSDRGTTRLIGAAYGFALNAGLAAPLLSARGLGRLPGGPVPVIGLVVMIFGLIVRVWAARTLGRFYTRTLRVAEDQTVVRSGPYRLVRHPGYAADLLQWLGFGLASRNAIVAAMIGLVMSLAYARRIQVEEAMLARQLGDPYRVYMQETWRLVPSLY